MAVSGTGAGAMELVDGRVISRHDAWGWLLGDEGSAQWVGRAAVRHALTDLESHGGAGADDLTRAVTTQLGLTLDHADAETAVNAVLRLAYAEPPHHLARLAPVLSVSGDPAAAVILAAAADLVAGHALRVLAGRTELPVVLAGSLAAAGGPLHDRLRVALAPYVASVSTVADGVVGACWLALTRTDRLADAVHARLLSSTVTAVRIDG